MPRRQEKKPDLALDLTPSSLHLLKRAQLQQHCKKLGLRGSGKNTELIQRLQEHYKQTQSGQNPPRTPPSAPSSQEKQDDLSQADPPSGRGWCVVHGQELTIDQWFPLTLRCGRVCLTSQGTFIQLHLAASSMPTPPGMRDNLICGQCMERNQEKESRLQRQKSLSQDPVCPGTIVKSSAPRSRNKSGKFQPQEDPEYAKRVDELLVQMASGQVDSQKVLQPIRPAVLHSPIGKQENSPVAIHT
ncbi:uncharacterized protein PAF06_013921 [Gastrophryne carolinensis]